ncbi:MFS transporter [Pseudomonas putida]|uniref:MFS transporter n=1 Tax=Pseudomonas putida TaxID=303 RepID=A0A8I1JKF4_PSEPU|nr:MFS transporter [Pseudomonas putida]MBI6884993.1 MFS transporter [Pseudomonas putida]
MAVNIESTTPATVVSVEKSSAKTVFAAAMGTVFEWYEFTLHGAMTYIIAAKFFTGLPPAVAFIFTLLTFAVGFIMRPLGAVLFGSVGDKLGRKKTFVITIVLMGAATTGVGLLPTYDIIGVWAPILLIVMRIVQGLAIGGEYGGAATYVAEHSPVGQRGLNTSWIAATGVAGLLMSFAMVLLCRTLTGSEFDVWGWRIPYLFSAVLLAFSLAVRLGMRESPAFERMKREDRLAEKPVKELFTQIKNIKVMLVALFGVCCAMSCCYYVAVLYPSFFMTQVLKVAPQQAGSVISLVLLTAMPVFLIAGWATDRFGRKKVFVLGLLMTAVVIFPVFKSLTYYANPALAEAVKHSPVTVVVRENDCSYFFGLGGGGEEFSICDTTKQALFTAGVSYNVSYTQDGEPLITIGKQEIKPVSLFSISEQSVQKTELLEKAISSALAISGYPVKADLERFSTWGVYFTLLLLVCCGVITYTPVSVILVEMFPARIRYTGISFPYHLASGWVGGLFPTVAFGMSSYVGNIYVGLAYPLFWIIVGLVVSVLFLKESRDVDIYT